ncbi:MAG: hypothetical protein OXG37_00960 [Actinomycetia bacterium]|nr:hypothetical protein [Actinomycetes bacterium]
MGDITNVPALEFHDDWSPLVFLLPKLDAPLRDLVSLGEFGCRQIGDLGELHGQQATPRPAAATVLVSASARRERVPLVRIAQPLALWLRVAVWGEQGFPGGLGLLVLGSAPL